MVRESSKQVRLLLRYDQTLNGVIFLSRPQWWSCHPPFGPRCSLGLGRGPEEPSGRPEPRRRRRKWGLASRAGTRKKKVLQKIYSLKKISKNIFQQFYFRSLLFARSERVLAFERNFSPAWNIYSAEFVYSAIWIVFSLSYLTAGSTGKSTTTTARSPPPCKSGVLCIIHFIRW